MTDATRAIVDYAENDEAKEMRDAFYNELQNRVMAHIENQKMEVAKTMFNQTPATSEVEDTEDTTQ